METKQLHRRSDLHLARKAFHIMGGSLLLYPLWYLNKPTEWMAALLGTLLAMVMSIEYARNNWPIVNHWVLRVLGPLMRESEKNRVSGIPFYLGSCLFSVLIFPKYIQVIAISHLVFGDPCSSFFGVLWGKDKLFPNKSLQGTLGGLVVCALVTGIFLYLFGIKDERLLLLIKGIDDNLAIPLISGAILLAVFVAAGLPLGPPL